MNQSNRKFPWINLVLFLVTLASTVFWGALHWIGFYYPEIGKNELISLLKSGKIILMGLPFSFSIMLILLSHEMGHYLMARKYGIDATLPYFIPAPNIVGTFGALIRIRGRIPSRKALFDVGAAGPITGFLVSIPFLFYGLMHSKLVEKIPRGGLSIGEPLIFKMFYKLFFPGIPSDRLLIHPVGFAAWVGLFITSLNLIPVGQLDGGHISYAVFGRDSNKLSLAVLLFLLYLSISKWWVWLLWVAIILVIGVYHPEFQYEDRLDVKRYILAVIVLIIFLVTFIPQPFTFVP